jgi:ankyrin repeat protein
MHAAFCTCYAKQIIDDLTFDPRARTPSVPSVCRVLAEEHGLVYALQEYAKLQRRADTIAAVEINIVQVVNYFLFSGVDPNARSSKTGDTALIYAASLVPEGVGLKNIGSQVVAALIAAGARVNDQNHAGRTAVMAAAKNDNVEGVGVKSMNM